MEGVSGRTLRRWKQDGPPAREAQVGRPPLSQEVRDEAKRLVLEQLQIQGWSVGERPIWIALEGSIPLARVRYALRELKAEQREREGRRIAERRTTIKVQLRDALWSMDATHLGRDEAGGSVLAEVLREVASGRTLEVPVGPAARGAQVVALLDKAVRARCTAPLVLLTDNGPQYKCGEVEAWCARTGVMHLFSLPRTPQHNAASEHGMRELKEETLLGKGARVLDIDAARDELYAAIERLDRGRLRATRGWRTGTGGRRAPHSLERGRGPRRVPRDGLLRDSGGPAPLKFRACSQARHS